MSAKAGRDYIKGMAFVVEGSTERVFYHEYLKWCCSQTAGASMEQLPNKDFVIVTDQGAVLLKFNVMGSVGSVPNAINWIRSICSKEAPHPWTVVLCYDTDGNAAQNLDTRAWLRFRQDLGSLGLPVIDLAADADIEDMMLVDIDGMRSYLGLEPGVELKGRKGKAKLNSLFKTIDVTQPYHEGERSRDLIRNLDFQVIETCAPLPIDEIRKAVF